MKLTWAMLLMSCNRTEHRLDCLLSVVRAVVKCPHCGKVHVDRAKWANFNHSKHVCMYCGCTFRSAQPCIGVDSL